MSESGPRAYFARHKAQLQVVWFLFFSLLALISQLLSRLIFDLAFQGLTDPVDIWPFPAQALGSFLAFLLSNVIAKVVSYITNRKQTFKATNRLSLSIAIYVLVVIVLIIVETIIGTPLQNALYGLFGGGFTGGVASTASALEPALYQVCGTASQLIYGIGDAIVIFVMDKYVIMTKAKPKGDGVDQDV